MIYKWTSLDSFNSWHEAIKSILGIPNEFASEYTKPLILNASDVRAFIREEEAALLPDLIGKESEAVIEAHTL